MRALINLCEYKLTDGFYSAPLLSDIRKLFDKHGDLRGVACRDTVYLAPAYNETHLDMRYQLGLPSDYGDAEDFGFNFYIAPIDAQYEHGHEHEVENEGRMDWTFTSPQFTVGRLGVWTDCDNLMSSLYNKQFARMVGKQPLEENIQPTLTLYHGTAIWNLTGILDHGLNPTVGEFTKSAYGVDDEEADEYGMQDLVFAADKKGINSCYSAILGSISAKMGREHRKIDDVVRYGALLMIKGHAEDFTHRAKDDDNDFGDHPYQVEPGDYYTDRRIQIAGVLTGKKLVRFLSRHGVRFDDSEHVRYMLDNLIKIFIKNGMTRREAIQKAKAMGAGESFDVFHRNDRKISY